MISGSTNGRTGIYQLTADGTGTATLVQRTGTAVTYVGSVFASSQQALGATNTWTNTAGGAWGTPANWSLGRPPGPNDNVVIPDLGVAGANLTIAFNVPTVSIANLTSSEKLSIDGGELIITGTLASAGTVTMNGGTLTRATIGSGTILATNGTGNTYGGIANAGFLYRRQQEPNCHWRRWWPKQHRRLAV